MLSSTDGCFVGLFQTNQVWRFPFFLVVQCQITIQLSAASIRWRESKKWPKVTFKIILCDKANGQNGKTVQSICKICSEQSEAEAAQEAEANGGECLWTHQGCQLLSSNHETSWISGHFILQNMNSLVLFQRQRNQKSCQCGGGLDASLEDQSKVVVQFYRENTDGLFKFVQVIILDKSYPRILVVETNLENTHLPWRPHIFTTCFKH